MDESGPTIARIHDQFTRLYCSEIHFSAAVGCVDGLFHRGEESVRLPLQLAHRALFVLLSHSGDDLAWRALKAARAAQDSTELDPPESR